MKTKTIAGLLMLGLMVTIDLLGELCVAGRQVAIEIRAGEIETVVLAREPHWRAEVVLVVRSVSVVRAAQAHAQRCEVGFRHSSTHVHYDGEKGFDALLDRLNLVRIGHGQPYARVGFVQLDLGNVGDDAVVPRQPPQAAEQGPAGDPRRTQGVQHAWLDELWHAQRQAGIAGSLDSDLPHTAHHPNRVARIRDSHPIQGHARAREHGSVIAAIRVDGSGQRKAARSDDRRIVWHVRTLTC